VPGLAVVSVDPANGQVGIYRNHPATVRIQNADSTDYTKIETLEADFADGTLTDVLARPDELVLLSTSVDDFEDDTIGQLPAGWDAQFGTGFSVQSSGGSQWVKHIKESASPAAIRWTAKGIFTSCDCKTKWKIDGAVTDPALALRLSGGAGTETMYTLQSVGDGATFRVYKRVNGSAAQQVGSNISFSHTTGTEYWMRFQAFGTAIKAKLWAASGSEPTSWMFTATDSAIASGYVGLAGYATPATYFDLFTVIGIGEYATSGNRVSPAYPLSSVGKFGSAVIEWDATVPTNTTLTIKVSKNGTAWTTVANGDHLALWNEGDDLAAENLYLKQELATTDVSVTPHLTEVRVIFRPVDPALVEIVVNGVSCTVANGGLTYWNTAVYSGGVIVDCHEDVWFATMLPWWDYGAETVELVVNVAEVERSATTFTTEESESFWANGYAKWMANALGGAYDGPMAGFGHYFISTIEPWLIRGEFHYNVQGAPKGAFDAYYYVAHVFSMDTPGSGIVGQPCPSDTPASGIVEGWTPSDTPASGIVQGWLRRDYPASGIAGVRFVRDEPASGIAGKRIQSDTPGSGVVYQVNANNTIELRVLSVEEAAALAELGISFE